MQRIFYFSEVKDPAVDWVFQFFSTVIGCSFHSTDEPCLAAIIFANTQVSEGQLRIPVWDGYYERSVEHCLHHSGYWVPTEMRDTEPPIDYIGLVFRLLTLMDELTVPNDSRDQLGNLSSKINFPRLVFSERPMVDEAVYELKQKLMEHDLLKDDGLLPKWHDGKCYAVLLTHDTDGPCLLEPKELIKTGIKGFVRSNIPERQAFLAGCRMVVTGRIQKRRRELQTRKQAS